MGDTSNETSKRTNICVCVFRHIHISNYKWMRSGKEVKGHIEWWHLSLPLMGDIGQHRPLKSRPFLPWTGVGGGLRRGSLRKWLEVKSQRKGRREPVRMRAGGGEHPVQKPHEVGQAGWEENDPRCTCRGVMGPDLVGGNEQVCLYSKWMGGHWIILYSGRTWCDSGFKTSPCGKLIASGQEWKLLLWFKGII